MNTYHTSVLLEEVLTALQIKKGKKYIDATLGGGGHALEIVKNGGNVLGIDVDTEALTFAKERIEREEGIDKSRITLVRGNFSDIDNLGETNGFERVSGILFDLGVSSHQLDEAARGFSFLWDGPLDMRMDQRLMVKASDLLNGLRREELENLFRRLGDEQKARQIAEAVVAKRAEKPIETTGDLVLAIAQAYHFTKPLSPKLKAQISMRVFQALRIAVNDELQVIEKALPKAVSLLENHGRLAVISFHSLEDRIVKHTFRELEEAGRGKVVTKKPITATIDEEDVNRRSRSAKLRVFEMIER